MTDANATRRGPHGRTRVRRTAISGGAGPVALVLFRHRRLASPVTPRTHKKEKAA